MPDQSFILFWLAYFVPSAVALIRNHKNKIAITILNILLGWTIIGWTVALIWSFTSTKDVHSQGVVGQ